MTTQQNTIANSFFHKEENSIQFENHKFSLESYGDKTKLTVETKDDLLEYSFDYDCETANAPYYLTCYEIYEVMCGQLNVEPARLVWD